MWELCSQVSLHKLYNDWRTYVQYRPSSCRLRYHTHREGSVYGLDGLMCFWLFFFFPDLFSSITQLFSQIIWYHLGRKFWLPAGEDLKLGIQQRNQRLDTHWLSKDHGIFFLFFCCALFWINQKEAMMPSDQNYYSLATWLCGILYLGSLSPPVPHPEGQTLPVNFLLTQCTYSTVGASHVYTMEATMMGLNWVFHIGAWSTSQQRRYPMPEAEEESKEGNVLVIGLK